MQTAPPGCYRSKMSDDLEGLTISEAALMLGVPAPTIRSWERRYGIGRTSRTSGRHRRYDVTGLAELRDLRDAIAAGRRAADAAELIHKRTREREQNPTFIEGILAASRDFDTAAIRRWLDAASSSLGLYRTVDVVILPALREIGSLWEAGRCDVANEHLASQEIRAWLSQQLSTARPKRKRPVLLFACGPKDLHTIGLEAFFVMLSRRGWNCRILGAMTPTDSVVTAARTAGSTAAVITSHLSTGRRAAVESIEALDAQGVSVFYAGNAFASAKARENVPGTYLGDELYVAAVTVERALVRA